MWSPMALEMLTKVFGDQKHVVIGMYGD